VAENNSDKKIDGNSSPLGDRGFKRYLITAALPYANGPIHIGHLAGVYLPADIYVRYLRAQKRDVTGPTQYVVRFEIRKLPARKGFATTKL